MTGDYNLTITVTDSSGVAFVRVQYRFGAGPWIERLMSQPYPSAHPDVYRYSIPRSEWLAECGKTLYWRVYANDSDASPSTGYWSWPDGAVAGDLIDDDTDAPVVQVTHPDQGELITDATLMAETGENMRIEFRLTDASGVDPSSVCVNWSFYGGPWSGWQPAVHYSGEWYYFEIPNDIALNNTGRTFRYCIKASDTDDDRTGDALWLVESLPGTYHWFMIRDDDTTAPDVSHTVPPSPRSHVDFQLVFTVQDAESGVLEVVLYYRPATGGSWL